MKNPQLIKSDDNANLSTRYYMYNIFKSIYNKYSTSISSDQSNLVT